MTQRKGIDRIAAVLSEQMGSMDDTAARMEKVAKTPLKIDDRALNESLKRAVSELNAVSKQNKKRLPNWVAGVLFFMLFFTLIFGFIVVSKLKAPNTIKIETQGQSIELGHDEVKFLHDFYLEHKE